MKHDDKPGLSLIRFGDANTPQDTDFDVLREVPQSLCEILLGFKFKTLKYNITMLCYVISESV